MPNFKQSVLIPVIFVLLWSTGFIGARYGLPYADAVNFIEWRFLIAGSTMAILAGIAGVRWPRGKLLLHICIAGLMLQGFYIWGVFVSIKLGLAAGVTSLITALQPLLTGLFAGWMLKERVTFWQFVGIILGLIGIFIVLSDRIAVPVLSFTMIAPACIAVLSITLGSLYQKRFCSNVDFRSAAALQFGTCAVVFAPFALWGGGSVTWNGHFILALAWASWGLSVMTLAVYYYLIRTGSAAKVSSLMYLVPPVTAIATWALFDEKIGLHALIGMVVVIVAVALVMSGGIKGMGLRQNTLNRK
ncbi:MAG: DMT family transporter [Alphaproteobacteria bacterium]|nr:DMT family transporter [Alphaproteobacteria bacterium]